MKNYTRVGALKIPKTDVVNIATWEDYLNRLQELAINLFEWKNLPPEIDVRFLEMTLFGTGSAVFYWEEIVERYVALTVMYGGDLDIYQIPKNRLAYAVNGYNCALTSNNSVLMFNNYLRSPDFPTLELYAQKLYDIDRALMTNVHLQRFPLIIKTPEGQRLTMENLMKKYDGNQPFIMAAPNLDLSTLETFPTQIPFVADKLMTLKQQTWNEVLQFLGVETVNTDKPAHLITDEVSANLGYAHAQRFVRLNARRQACEQINKMFGLDIWVNFKSDISSVLNQTTEDPTSQAEQRMVQENERLYNADSVDY